MINLLSKKSHPRTIETSQPTKTKRDNRSPPHETTPKNLFDVLPFKGINLADDEEYKPFAKIPYIPGPTYHIIKRSLKKAGVNICATSGKKLSSILCSRNKTKPNPTVKKGIYKITCPSDDKAVYIGQTTRSIFTRSQEHRKAVEKGQWHHSGISQHKQTCSEPIDWDNPEVLANMRGKNKKQLAYNLKIREALEIRRHNCGPGHGLNEDLGAYIRTQQWGPVFNTMGHR